MELVLGIVIVAFVAVVTTDTVQYRRYHQSKNR